MLFWLAVGNNDNNNAAGALCPRFEDERVRMKSFRATAHYWHNGTLCGRARRHSRRLFFAAFSILLCVRVRSFRSIATPIVVDVALMYEDIFSTGIFDTCMIRL